MTDPTFSQQVIRAVQPTAVMIELCPARYVNMLAKRVPASEDAPPRGAGPPSGKGEEIQGTGKLLAKTLSRMYKAFANVGIKPGREFEAAQDVSWEGWRVGEGEGHKVGML